jgi:hypothetical protein
MSKRKEGEKSNISARRLTHKLKLEVPNDTRVSILPLLDGEEREVRHSLKGQSVEPSAMNSQTDKKSTKVSTVRESLQRQQNRPV